VPESQERVFEPAVSIDVATYAQRYSGTRTRTLHAAALARSRSALSLSVVSGENGVALL